jgi:hypothetical protein
VGNRFDLVARLDGKHLASQVGAGEGMVGIGIGAPGHVVKQGRGAYDLRVSSLHFGQSFRKDQYPKDVVKVMHGVGAAVESANLIDRDHSCPQTDSVLESAFLRNSRS